jgi:hypothetical protein
MDKLFDLMVMGAKYCLMCSTQLDEMIQVPRNNQLPAHAQITPLPSLVIPKPACVCTAKQQPSSI